MLLYAGLFVAGTAAALFGERGLLDLRESRLEMKRLERDVARQLERIVRLRREVRALIEDPREIERLAREELGLVRPGEIQFVLPGPDPLQSPLLERRAPGRDGEDADEAREAQAEGRRDASFGGDSTGRPSRSPNEE